MAVAAISGRPASLDAPEISRFSARATFEARLACSPSGTAAAVSWVDHFSFCRSEATLAGLGREVVFASRRPVAVVRWIEDGAERHRFTAIQGTRTGGWRWRTPALQVAARFQRTAFGY